MTTFGEIQFWPFRGESVLNRTEWDKRQGGMAAFEQ